MKELTQKVLNDHWKQLELAESKKITLSNPSRIIYAECNMMKIINTKTNIECCYECKDGNVWTEILNLKGHL